MKYLQEVINNLKNGKNIIFYKKNVYPYYKKLKGSFNCVYLNEPVPVKRQLSRILDNITDKKITSTSKNTISDLKELIIQELDYKTLVIMFNHFERLAKKAVESYEYLNSIKKIVFVASFNSNFNSVAYPFFKKFIFLNKEECKKIIKKDEINVTYPLYFILSIISFAVYIKFAMSAYSQTLFFPVIVIGGLWFSFMVFRTFMFAGGKI